MWGGGDMKIILKILDKTVEKSVEVWYNSEIRCEFSNRNYYF
jgi:hypothetical protein